MPKNGLTQVYYTKSAGEINFAPFGLSLRAVGQGFRVLIFCFVPFELMQGALVASELLKPNLVIEPFEFKKSTSQREGAKTSLHRFQKAGQVIKKGIFDMVILEGILSLMHKGQIPIEELIELIKQKPPAVELVLTGLGAPIEIIGKADLVTEMALTAPKKAPDEQGKLDKLDSVEVITGDGKGKTTYCIGKAALASCMNNHCVILQFIKSPLPYGEIKAASRFPNLSINTLGKGFLNMDGKGIEEKHLNAAEYAWNIALGEISSRRHALLALDEINIAIHHGLIKISQVKEMLDIKPKGLQLLLSGRNANPEVMKAATTVIEMKEIKHPFNKGIKARKGIEF